MHVIKRDGAREEVKIEKILHAVNRACRGIQNVESLEIAKRTIAACDSSKFGRRSLSLIIAPSAVHHVITDRGIPKADMQAIKKAGIELTLV